MCVHVSDGVCVCVQECVLACAAVCVCRSVCVRVYCGGVTQTETRCVTIPATNGGADCPPLTNTRTEGVIA
jgi:hypothetical protein